MPEIDWSNPEDTAYGPGEYHVEVREADLERSKKGDQYFKIALRVVDGAPLCDDILMLGGKGRHIGTKKLRGLGFTEADKNVEARDLVGRRAYATVGEEEFTSDKGQTTRRLKVDIKAGDFCGYRRDEDAAISASDPSTWPQDHEISDPF